jgi:GTP cyclohydrolase I
MPLTYTLLHQQLEQMLQLLQAQEGCVQAEFHFFMEKTAPVSGVNSLLDYQGRWKAQTCGGITSIWAEVGVPVKSLCPCSKEISEYGAHNQRSIITIKAELLQPIAWEELVRTGEESASSEIWHSQHPFPQPDLPFAGHVPDCHCGCCRFQRSQRRGYSQ